MKNKRIIIVYVLLTFVVVSAIYYAISYNKNSENTIELNSESNTISFDKVEQIINHQNKDVKLSNRKICLFINMKNFECHFCFEQFLKIVDIINSKYKKDAESVLLLFPENKEEGDFQKIKLKKWLKINKISYEYIILKSETEDLNFKRSFLTLRKNDVIEFTIPMTASDLDKFEKLL